MRIFQNSHWKNCSGNLWKSLKPHSECFQMRNCRKNSALKISGKFDHVSSENLWSTFEKSHLQDHSTYRVGAWQTRTHTMTPISCLNITETRHLLWEQLPPSCPYPRTGCRPATARPPPGPPPIHIYIYICIHICIYIYIYLFIYRLISLFFIYSYIYIF